MSALAWCTASTGCAAAVLLKRIQLPRSLQAMREETVYNLLIEDLLEGEQTYLPVPPSPFHEEDHLDTLGLGSS